MYIIQNQSNLKKTHNTFLELYAKLLPIFIFHIFEFPLNRSALYKIFLNILHFVELSSGTGLLNLFFYIIVYFFKSSRYYITGGFFQQKNILEVIQFMMLQSVWVMCFFKSENVEHRYLTRTYFQYLFEIKIHYTRQHFEECF